MSPEQARGDELDARTDLFSLSAVLYEMCTGRPAFEGKTSAVIFQQILSATPPRPRELNPALPVRLDDVILKGLEKDRDLRYQTAAELRGDLKRLKRDASSGDAVTVAAVAAPGRRRLNGVVVAGAALAVIAAVAYGVYSLAGRRSVQPATAAVEPSTPVRITTCGDVRGCGSISPDGKYVVYCNLANRLMVQQVATGSIVPLYDAIASTTFSPDSDLIYLTVNASAQHPAGAVLVIPAIGGASRGGSSAMPAGRSPSRRTGDASPFCGPMRPSARSKWSSPMHRAGTSAGSHPRRSTRRGSSLPACRGRTTARCCQRRSRRSSADSRCVPSSSRSRPAPSTRWALRRGSRSEEPCWLPDRRLLFAAQERAFGPYQFWIATYPDGGAVRITNDLRGFGNISVSVTGDGKTIATVPVQSISNLWATNADATAPLEQWTSGSRDDGVEGIAPQRDGRVFFSAVDGDSIGVWSVDAAGGRPRKLTRVAAGAPSIPSDGRFVIFQALDEGRMRIFRMQPDGSDSRRLTQGEDDYRSLVSPDGRWVYYSTGTALMRMPAEGGESTRVADATHELLDISPDGRQLMVAVPRDPATGTTHALIDAESGALQSRLTDLAGVSPRWGRSANLIAALVNRDGVTNLWERPISGGEARQLTNFTTGRMFNFAYSPDRKRLFLARGTRTGDVVLIRLAR